MRDAQVIADIQELASIVHKAVSEMREAPSVAFEERDGKYWLTGSGIKLSAELAKDKINFVRHGINSDSLRFFRENIVIDGYKDNNVYLSVRNKIDDAYLAVVALLRAETALQNSRLPKQDTGYKKLERMFED